MRSMVGLAEALDLSVTAEGSRPRLSVRNFASSGAIAVRDIYSRNPLAPAELADILSGNPPGFDETDLAAA